MHLEEDLSDVPMAKKRRDPLFNARIRRRISGMDYGGIVEDTECGRSSGLTLYRIRYDDGDLEHYTAGAVRKHLVRDSVVPVEICSESPHRSQTNAGHKRKVEEDCIICLELLVPPVFQCCRGHLLCRECIDKVENENRGCQTCRGPMPVPRVECLLFKQIAEGMEYPCPHRGCKAKLSSSNFWNHKQTCQYRPYQCGYCDVLVPAADMSKHVRQMHKDFTVTAIKSDTVEKQGAGSSLVISASGDIGFDEAHMCSAVGITIILDIAQPESDVTKSYYGFVTALAPGLGIDRSLECRLTIMKDGSKLMCEGPAYSYDTWLDSFDAMIGMGCPFMLARRKGECAWSDDQGSSCFKYRLDVMVGAAGLSPD